MLVRRFSEATETEIHRIRAHVLMDPGDLGARNLSVHWLAVPAGASEELRSHEEAEQVYVVVRGAGTMAALGESQQLGPGDLVLIPPATEHSLANDGTEPLAVLSVQSPGVEADELYSLRLASQAAGYEFEDE